MGNVIMRAQQITYGASNVEKALDDLNVPELIELNKRMAAVDAWKANVHEETYTGSELTINNALALPARTLKTTINAIQDLHGYDHPWVGGAGKNKLDFAVNTPLTVSGLTLTPLGDGGFKLNGTSTAAGILIWNMSMVDGGTSPTANQGIKTIPNGTYKFTFLRTGLNTQVRGSTTASGGDNHIATSAISEEFTIDDTYPYNWVRLQFDSGLTFNNEVFYPMIRLSTESDATFAPYSNICPISGRDSVVLTRSDGDEISEDFTIQLGQTVYGADINWDTGVMTVKTALVDISTLDYTPSSPENHVFRTDSLQGLILPPPDGSTPANAISSAYKAMGYAPLNPVDNGRFAVAQYGAVVYARTVFIDHRSSTVAEFISNNSGQTLCYELEHPTTIQLTPEQLEMLKGYNRITVASGYATIELKALILGGV